MHVYCVNYRKIEHLHDNLSIPIYDQTPKHYTAKNIVEVRATGQTSPIESDSHLPACPR